MKKFLNKVRRKKEPEAPAGRITTETIAEHRERILAGGRRFKYPVQYARHRLVFNAIIIGVAVIVLLIAFVWWQLYLIQNTSDFMYRVTKVVPVPVASVDGEQVRYSDYLMKYRSNVHYLEEKEQVNFSTEDGKRQSDYIKQQSMQDAIADAYAQKLARERGISVSDAELEQFLKQQRASTDGAVSESTYDAVIADYYGWSPDEYRHAMREKLLRQKVAFAVDQKAEKAVQAAVKAVASNTDLKAVAESLNTTLADKVVFGAPGAVPRANQDGGLAVAAAALEKGAVSAPIKSTTGDGYYLVKLVDSTTTSVTYEYIHVPLSVFADMVTKVKEDGKVREFITVPDVPTTNQ